MKPPPMSSTVPISRQALREAAHDLARRVEQLAVALAQHGLAAVRQRARHVERARAHCARADQDALLREYAALLRGLLGDRRGRL
jgi:hypothetical protein